MKTLFGFALALFLVSGCGKKTEEAPPVPKGQETVTTALPQKGGGTKGITEDQIELGPGVAQADSRAGSKTGGQ
jgi:hypothetical protein